LAAVVRRARRRHDRLRRIHRPALGRRRGGRFAAAATAAWAARPALGDRVRFYSTQASNVSSQRVAQRLGLRLVGTTVSVA
jgi:hypothetical protein